MRIFKEFQIEAAHMLPNVPEDHKCRRLHGHSYKIEIHVSGEPGEDSGWIMDFADVGDRVNSKKTVSGHYRPRPSSSLIGWRPAQDCVLQVDGRYLNRETQ